MRNLCFWWLFLQIKNCWILNFKWIKYLGKGLSCLKDGGIGVNYCWNHGPSKLLLHFIEYSLDQLNKKHTKIAVNSTIQCFGGSSQKKCLLKVWIFGLLTTKWRPCKIFAQLNGNHLLMANVFILPEYQTFG